MAGMLALLLARSAASDSITLRPAVRLAAAAAEVRLGDVADLQGPSAEALAGVVLLTLDGRTEARELSIGEVRAILGDAGANWGLIQLSGRAVVLRPPPAPRGPAPMAMTAQSIVAAPPGPEPLDQPPAVPPGEVAAALIDLPTVKGVIARSIAAGLSRAPADVRLLVDADDAPLLDRALESARFEIRPLTSLHSDRIELQVRQWIDGRVRGNDSISVGLLLRTETAVPRRDIDRGEPLSDADLEARREWLPPSQAALMSGVAEATGRVAARSLKAGDAIRAQHVRRETLIRRGDPIIVRCLVGGVVITLQAEARADGSEGDTIEVRKTGERTSFRAVVAGPGETVLDLSRPAPKETSS